MQWTENTIGHTGSCESIQFVYIPPCKIPNMTYHPDKCLSSENTMIDVGMLVRE